VGGLKLLSLDVFAIMLHNRGMKKPRDLNQLALSIVAAAVGEGERQLPAAEKDPAAVALGKKGGLRGGVTRAANLTPEQRTEAARIAARARWKKSSD
jgi:hypothetical protein